MKFPSESIEKNPLMTEGVDLTLEELLSLFQKKEKHVDERGGVSRMY